MKTPRLFRPRAIDNPNRSSVHVAQVPHNNQVTVVSSRAESLGGNVNSVSSHPPSRIVQDALVAQAESVTKCIDAFGDEALDMASGKVTAASVLALANSKRTEKAPVEGSKTDKVLKWAISFAKNVDAYSKMLDVYISKAPEVAGLVWGGCKILLQTGLNHIDVLEKLFAILNRIGENIGRFQQYEALFGESERMKYALALIYTDVLELSVSAALFYRKNGFLNYLSSIVKNFDARFGSTLASFYQHKELLEDEVWAAYLGRVLGQKPDVSIKDLRRWLTPPGHEPDYLYSSRFEAISKRVSGSCVWFKPHLEKFLKAEEQPILAIVGGPGVGKTALAAWIMDEIESQSQKLPYGTVLQFIIKGNQQYRCSSFDLLRAFLLQLLETNVGSSAIHQRLAVTFGKSVRTKATRDSENLLWQDLGEILAALDHIVLVIDGLDELEGGEQAAQNSIQHLANICEYRKGQPKKLHLKVIVTTRPLQLDFTGQTFSIQPHHTKSDIANYVDIRLYEMTATSNSPFHRVQQSDRVQIASKIKEGAEGMILWAKLILEEMAGKKTLPQIHECLENAPSELTQLYTKLYEGFDHSNPDTKTILDWLICSQRPLSLAEIEAILEIDVDGCNVCKRLTPVLLDIQDACGPLVEVSSYKPYTIQLVHYSVRQWMLRESSPAFSLQRSHLQAFRTAAVYLSLLFPDQRCILGEETPVLVPTLSQKQKLIDLCHGYAFLEYSASFWISHLSYLQISGPKSISECTEEWGEACRLLSTSTPNLAVMEAVLWRVHGSYNSLKKLHQSAFDMRSKYLDPEDSEMVQTTANLAVVYELLLDYARASDMYQKAWVACQAQFGHQKMITYEFANAFALNLEKQEKGIDSEQVYIWMWQSLQKRLGNDHEETLTMAGRLAWMYQRHERFEEANNVYGEIWETWARKLGHLDEQTILAAGYYARALQLVGQNESAIEVHRVRLQAANEQLQKIDQSYLAALIVVAQAYEFAGLPERAESMMRDTLKDLDVADNTPAKSTAYMVMCIEISRLLQRRSRSPEAQVVLKGQFSWCEVQLDFEKPMDEVLLRLLKDFAHELQKHELFSEARRVISWLHNYYKFFEGIRSEAALGSIYWLAYAALEDNDASKELELLHGVYDTAKEGGIYDKVTLESSRHLALSIHERNDWEALEVLSKEVLEHIWPSVLINGPQQQLPNQHAKEAVVVARRLALAYQKQDLLLRSRWSYSVKTSQPLDKAEELYFNIHSSYNLSDGPDAKSTLGAAAELGKFYESRCKFDRAEAMYQLVYDTNCGALGLSQASTLRSVLKLAKFYERRDNWSKSETLQEEALKQIRRDWGSEHPSVLEIEMNLIIIRKKLGKAEPSGMKLATRLKSDFMSDQKPSSEHTADNTVLKELYTEQLKALKGTDLSLEVLTRTQSLYQGRAGQLNRTSLKGAMKLGDLLERHKMESAATHWYEHIVTENKDQPVSPVLLYEPARRLAHLYEIAAQIEKAERMYQLNWQNIKGKTGGNPADESSLRAFRDLFRFFQRTDPSQEKALGLLKIAWEEVKAEKSHIDAFHKAAETDVNFYLLLDKPNSASEICREAVSFLPNGKLEDRSRNLLRRMCEKIGRETRDAVLDVWNAHKGALGCDGAVTLAVGEDLAKHCDESGKITMASKIYEDLFTTCWSAKAIGPAHDKTVEFGLALARQSRRKDDYKSADELHVKLFDALRSDKSTPLPLALSKYKKLAWSCYLQNRLDAHADSTSQKIILHTVNISKELDGYYTRSTLDLLDQYRACCERSPSPKDKEDLLETYEDFYHHRSLPLAWNEPQASAIGRTLARLYFTSGREILALGTISEVIRHDEREYGLTNRSTIASYNAKSELCFERREYEAALHIHEKILSGFAGTGARAGQVDFVEMLHQYHMKGRALQRLGRFAQARGIYDEAFRMSSRLYGPGGFYKHKLDNIKMWSQKGYEGS